MELKDAQEWETSVLKRLIVARANVARLEEEHRAAHEMVNKLEQRIRVERALRSAATRKKNGGL